VILPGAAMHNIAAPDFDCSILFSKGTTITDLKSGSIAGLAATVALYALMLGRFSMGSRSIRQVSWGSSTVRTSPFTVNVVMEPLLFLNCFVVRHGSPQAEVTLFVHFGR